MIILLVNNKFAASVFHWSIICASAQCCCWAVHEREMIGCVCCVTMLLRPDENLLLSEQSCDTFPSGKQHTKCQHTDCYRYVRVPCHDMFCIIHIALALGVPGIVKFSKNCWQQLGFQEKCEARDDWSLSRLTHVPLNLFLELNIFKVSGVSLVGKGTLI